MPYDPIVTPYQLSAFGLLRTGAPYTLADIVNRYEIDAKTWGTSVTGTGAVAHVAAVAGISVKAGGAIGTALLRTHEYYRYQAGKGCRWTMTGFSTDTGNALNVRRWGQFDDDDGLYFQHARADDRNYFDIVIRSSSGVGAQTVQQRDWNRNSYPALGPTKGNIFECVYQWLGVGTVGFYVNGFLVHTIEHANTLAGPYMRTAQLPLSAQVLDAGGSAGLSGWTSICSAIISEGGTDPPEYGFAYAKPSAPFALSTTETPLLSLRPANLINAIANRTFLLPKHSSLGASNFAGGADTATFKVYLNSTLTTGLSWTAVGGASHAERDIGTTAAGFTPGTLIETALVDATSAGTILTSYNGLFGVHGRKLLRRDLATVTLDIITVTCSINAGTATGSCDISWTET